MPAMSLIRTRCSHSIPQICAATSATKDAEARPIARTGLYCAQIGADEDRFETLPHCEHAARLVKRSRRESEMAEWKAAAVCDEGGQVRALLVEGGHEIAAVRTVEQSVRGGIPGGRIRRTASEGIAVEGDPDPLSADGGIDEVKNWIRRGEHVGHLPKAGGRNRGAATGEHHLLHEAAPGRHGFEMAHRFEDLLQAPALGRDWFGHL